MTGIDLKLLRLEHVLTQRAMAELLGYTANYIARLERGEEPITQRFEKLAHAMLAQKKVKEYLDTP